MVDVNEMMVGTVVSITMALPEAILVPGTLIVLAIALPAMSVTVPMLKVLYG